MKLILNFFNLVPLNSFKQVHQLFWLKMTTIFLEDFLYCSRSSNDKPLLQQNESQESTELDLLATENSSLQKKSQFSISKELQDQKG